jgi:hypothetical protein
MVAETSHTTAYGQGVVTFSVSGMGKCTTPSARQGGCDVIRAGQTAGRPSAPMKWPVVGGP